MIKNWMVEQYKAGNLEGIPEEVLAELKEKYGEPGSEKTDEPEAA